MADTIKINLALQGGGAHGAFTWGVLDRILEDEDIEISALSGTSAGALNASAFKAGMVQGGREGAKEKLNWVWDQVGAVKDGRMQAWMEGVDLSKMAQAIEYSPMFAAADFWSRAVSPYSYGPFYSNPLEPILATFDFDAICADKGPALFICATRVRNGKIRVFSGDEIHPEAIMASACLPTVFQAVKIHDSQTGREEAFWDGGYTGNPALYPMFEDRYPPDIVIVNINPLEREDLPVTAHQIQNRINEISFNSSLLREMRAINFVQRLIEDGTIHTGRMSQVYVHMVADDELMNTLSVATKMMPNPIVLSRLKDAGRTAAEKFLTMHKKDLGKRSTVDLRAMFS
ncbi:patatin-like phospholipase family protein [Chachezhania antarctica]|uniref:patatin-like phospholipase family protein n=1 Tax=Chachezhania antarctica TaxID=2340860 RepID=UPI000EB3890E|nr:patatin-like phospholipase family protein [Chachezhania antarctica]